MTDFVTQNAFDEHEGNMIDLPPAAFDPDMLEALDGGLAEAFARRKTLLTKVLLNGETGVVFESLALFAEPLFALYELDPAEAFQLRSDPDAVGDDVVALLETARVLWAFLSLPGTERGHNRMVLAQQLVGDDPAEDDWVNLDGLIEAAEIHWKALLPEEIEVAQKTPHETLDFGGLLKHPAFSLGSAREEGTQAGYGLGSLSEIEARALFAQPLLDAPDTMTDGDAFEDAIALADELWTLAQRSSGDSASAARDFAVINASSPDSVKDLEATAASMIQRYWELFPERAPKA